MMIRKSQSNNYLHYLRLQLFFLVIVCVGCGSQAVDTSFTQVNQTNQTNKFTHNLPKVVATTSVLCDLIKQIAEETIDLTCLIPPGADPHGYQFKPEDRQAIEKARLIFYNGYNLEPSLIKVIKTTKNSSPKIAVAQLVQPQTKKLSKGDKKLIDPHLWHNTQNTIKMVEVINRSLGKLEPSNVENYRNNSRKITKELTQLDSWIKSRILSIPIQKRKLVTTHDALGYYAKAYGLKYIGVLKGINSREKPTDARVKNLIIGIEKYKVPTIFAETTINSNLIESIAGKAQVKLSHRELYTDGLGTSGSDGETYQKMMVANTRTIVEGLGGTYLKFQPKFTN